MKKILEFFLYFFFSLTFTPLNAATLSQDCEKHAGDVMMMAVEITVLNDEQYRILKNIIMKSCLENIIKSKNNTVENIDDKDWFTEKILSGETDRKEGNKRLKKLK